MATKAGRKEGEVPAAATGKKEEKEKLLKQRREHNDVAGWLAGEAVVDRRRWQQCTKPPEQTVKPALEGTERKADCAGEKTNSQEQAEKENNRGREGGGRATALAGEELRLCSLAMQRRGNLTSVPTRQPRHGRSILTHAR